MDEEIEALLAEALRGAHERVGEVEAFSGTQTGVKATDTGDHSTGYLRVLPRDEVRT